MLSNSVKQLHAQNTQLILSCDYMCGSLCECEAPAECSFQVEEEQLTRSLITEALKLGLYISWSKQNNSAFPFCFITFLTAQRKKKLLFNTWLLPYPADWRKRWQNLFIFLFQQAPVFSEAERRQSRIVLLLIKQIQASSMWN